LTLVLRMALRNLLKHRARTAITLSAVSLSAAFLFANLALIEGVHSEWLEGALRVAGKGMLEVYHPRYKEESNVRYSIPFGPEQEKALLGLPQVEVAAPRVETAVLLALGSQSVAVSLRGVRWREETVLSPIRVTQGRAWKPGEGGILLGEPLAEAIGASLGDSALVLGQDAYGSLAVDVLPVLGFYRTSNPERDKFSVLMDLSVLQEFLLIPGRATEVSIWTRPGTKLRDLRTEVQKLLGSGYEVLTWEEDLPQLKQLLDLDSGGAYITISALAFLVVLVVFSTLLMSVLERIREFGVMGAIGARPGMVRCIVLAESLLIGLSGSAAGGLVGFAISLPLSVRPLSVHSEALVQWMGSTEMVITTRILPQHFFYTLLLTSATALLGGLWPASKAARLHPAEALRHV